MKRVLPALVLVLALVCIGGVSSASASSAGSKLTPAQIERNIVKAMESKPGRENTKNRIYPDDRPHMLLNRASISKSGHVASIAGKKNGYLSNVRLTDYTLGRYLELKTYMQPGYRIGDIPRRPKTTYKPDIKRLGKKVITVTGKDASRFGPISSIVATKKGRTWNRAIATFIRANVGGSIHTVTLNSKGRVSKIVVYKPLSSHGRATAAASGRHCSRFSDFYNVRVLRISCTNAMQVLRKVARTSCTFGEVCEAGGFKYRLSGPPKTTTARHGNQSISWRSTFAD